MNNRDELNISRVRALLICFFPLAGANQGEKFVTARAPSPAREARALPGERASGARVSFGSLAGQTSLPSS